MSWACDAPRVARTVQHTATCERLTDGSLGRAQCTDDAQRPQPLMSRLRTPQGYRPGGRSSLWSVVLLFGAIQSHEGGDDGLVNAA